LFLLNSLISGLFLQGVVSFETFLILYVGVFAYCGFSASDWLEESMERRGYLQRNIVFAKDRIHAMLRLMEQQAKG